MTRPLTLAEALARAQSLAAEEWDAREELERQEALLAQALEDGADPAELDDGPYAAACKTWERASTRAELALRDWHAMETHPQEAA